MKLNNCPTVYALDFDGTLTTCDTLLAFIRHSRGTSSLAMALMVHAPWLLAMKLHLCPGGKVKERLLGWLFKGTSEQEFQELCQHFAADNRHLLRPAGIETIKDAIANGIRVVVVSASIETWVRPFFSQYPEVTVVGTRMQVADGQLTGRFEGPNCYGQEKVNRLEALLGNRADYHLKAFGDSRGDKELFAFADEHIYKPFRNKEQEELCQE